MTHRQRLQATLNHRAPDRVCVDFGGTAVTGIHVSAVTRLRQAVLGEKDHRVKVVEPYQMLGEIDEPLREALGIDVWGIPGRTTMFGFENTGWKPFEMFDGTGVLVPEDFRTTIDPSGDLLLYPQGDTSAPPRGRMPRGGHFFDAIVIQEPIDEGRLDPADNISDFALLGEKDLQHYREQARRAAVGGAGTIFWIPGAGVGDIAQVPGPWLKAPKGIRDVEEWYVSTVLRRDYVRAVFEGQCAIAERNIELLAGAIGDCADAAVVSGTDFGTQRSLFISVAAYRDLFKPYHVRLNRLIHAKTGWKTFVHSCGCVTDLIPEFIDAGFDILNPVQTSAAGMDPKWLKKEFGRLIVFWGGGVDTQHTLAKAAPSEVYRQVRERIDVFGEGGGFVFNAIHNVQADTPTENLLAMFKAIRDSGGT